MSLYEPMDTDHRQTLLDLNQDKELEILISDIMNHTFSPNALAKSRELVKLDNALECLKDTLRSTSRTAKLWLRFVDYIEIIKDFICCEKLGMCDGHLNFRHRITESFRSDRSYSLCQVCSPLCPGNAQASVNSSLAAPEVCRRISHCAKE